MTPKPQVGDIWRFLESHYLVLDIVYQLDSPRYKCYCLEDDTTDFFLCKSESWRFVA